MSGYTYYFKKEIVIFTFLLGCPTWYQDTRSLNTFAALELNPMGKNGYFRDGKIGICIYQVFLTYLFKN